jgi:hypothetical protein
MAFRLKLAQDIGGSEYEQIQANKGVSNPVERNRSMYSFINSVKRNKLNSKAVDKLVYIYGNIRSKPQDH